MLGNMFSTFLYAKNIPGVRNGELRKFGYRLKSKHRSLSRSNYAGWQSGYLLGSEDLPPEFGRLTGKFERIVNSLSHLLGLKDNLNLVLTELWININPTGSFNRPHRHPASFLSGVYYLDVNKKSGALVFANPFDMYNHFNRQWMGRHTSQTASTVTLQPVNSKLVIFPSWVSHYVEPNVSKRDRISISFNTTVK